MAVAAAAGTCAVFGLALLGAGVLGSALAVEAWSGPGFG